MSIETAPYRVSASPSLDLAIPPDAPHIPPPVSEADRAMRGRYDDCVERGRELRDAQAQIEAAVARDRHNAWQAAERGERESGNPEEERARDLAADAERALDASSNAWKWSCRELATQIHAARDEWFEALDAEIAKAHDRLQGQLDRVQAAFDGLERVQLLRAGLAEIGEPGSQLSGIALNTETSTSYRMAERQRVREYTLERGAGMTVPTTVDELTNALRWLVERGPVEPGRAAW